MKAPEYGKLFFFILIGMNMRLTQAQEDFVVTNKKDTIKGKVGFTQRSFYDIVDVRNDGGKQTFKAYQIIYASKDGSQYHPITFNNRRVIGKVINAGHLSHYLVMEEGSNRFENAILLKEDGSALQISYVGFRKRLMEFLKSCPAVVDKIKSKELAASDLEKILSSYNSECSYSN